MPNRKEILALQIEQSTHSSNVAVFSLLNIIQMKKKTERKKSKSYTECSCIILIYHLGIKYENNICVYGWTAGN